MKFLSLKWKGRTRHLWAEKTEGRIWIHFQGTAWQWKGPERAGKRRAGDTSAPGLKEKVISPLPGRILSLPFKPGDRIKKGAVLLVLSAMKMEYSFKAEAKGQIEEIFCKAGDQVTEDQVLIKLKYDSI